MQQKGKEFSKRALIAGVIFALSSTLLHADVTLTYTTTNEADDDAEKTFRVMGRFIRIDNGAEDIPGYVILDAGMMRLSTVDETNKQYKRENIISTWEDYKSKGRNNPDRHLNLTKESHEVAGVKCRIVEEYNKKILTATHCMAPTAALKISRREAISMARLFEIMPSMDSHWITIGSPDETLVSIESQSIDGKTSQQLQSIVYSNIAEHYMQVPKTFKNVQPN